MTPGGPDRRGEARAVDPLLVATAAEAVLHAGGMQRARFGTSVQIDKKGEIDLW